MDKRVWKTERDLTCQASSSCDSASLRWMASNNWLFRDIMSFLLLTNSASIRFFLQRKSRNPFSHITVTNNNQFKSSFLKENFKLCLYFCFKTYICRTEIHWFVLIVQTKHCRIIIASMIAAYIGFFYYFHWEYSGRKCFTWLWLHLGLWWPAGQIQSAPARSAASASAQSFPAAAGRSAGGRNEQC